MKMTYFALVGLMLSSGLWYGTASADFAARRSAVVVRGPGGGVAVGVSRTAIVRRGYGFLAQEAQERKSSEKLSQVPVKPKSDPSSGH